MAAKAKSPIHLERKVVAQTILTALATAALAILNGLNGSDLLGSFPAWAQSLVIFVGPTAISFLGGYVAKHSLRDDLEELGKEVGLTPAPSDVVVVDTTQVAADVPAGPVDVEDSADEL